MGKVILDLSAHIDEIGCVIALILLVRSREFRSYSGLTGLLSIRLLSDVVELCIVQASHRHLVSSLAGYSAYFYTYWLSYAAESLLAFYMILNIFRVALQPLKGLRSLGMLVFRWAAAISTVLSVALSVSPHQSTSTWFAHFLSEFQQISSVITLCLLLFVCFTIKPLGLTLKSRVFGVALGLGLLATAGLAQAAWFNFRGGLYTTANLVANIGSVLGIAVWCAYFAMPEPKRRIIVLPTTSPFLRWNQISEVLGDEPGFVAIAGVPPELFAPAEIEVMVRASIKMNTLAEFDPEASSVTLKTLSA